MTFNFDVNTLKEHLANGASMEDIAQAMTNALNQAQKEHEAEEAKRKEVESKREKEAAVAKARADVYMAVRKYLELTMPTLTEICDENDWADLEKTMADALAEMETAFKMILPLMNMEKVIAKPAVRATKASSPQGVLEEFLAQNGLLN